MIMAKQQIKLSELKDAILRDVDDARHQILEASGDIMADKVIDASGAKVVPEIMGGDVSTWVGVIGEDDFLAAMREEKYGTRPFAKTINWMRTREPFVRELQAKLPWIK